MVTGKKIDFVDFVQFVIVKDLNVFILQQVEIDLMAIVSDSHYKSPVEIQSLDLLMER